MSFAVMPHFPARIIKDKATLSDWVARYKDVGVKQGLLLAGGVAQPAAITPPRCSFWNRAPSTGSSG